MKNSEQPAHPTLLYDDTSGTPSGHRGGLTKREFVVIMAMQGVLANLQNYRVKGKELTAKAVADMAVKVADAILLELEKPANV